MCNKILVTGSKGFVGHALFSYLQNEWAFGSSVIGVDRVGDAGSSKGFHLLDLIRSGDLGRFLCRYRPSIIFHCAGGKMKDRPTNFEANVTTTLNLLDAIAHIPKYSPRVVIIGSAAEYGDGPGKIWTEKSRGVPCGEYGWAKLVQTQVSRCYAWNGLDVVVGRIFNIVGPGLPPITAPGHFAREIVLREKKFKRGQIVTGSLNLIRDFVDIRDVCSALYLVALKGQAGEIYNICSQRPVSLRTLLQRMIHHSTSRRIKFRETTKKSDGVPRAVGSNAKLRRATGWRIRYALEDSLRSMLDFYRTQNKGQPCAF